jgi:hypothetical protein
MFHLNEKVIGALGRLSRRNPTLLSHITRRFRQRIRRFPKPLRHRLASRGLKDERKRRLSQTILAYDGIAMVVNTETR